MILFIIRSVGIREAVLYDLVSLQPGGIAGGWPDRTGSPVSITNRVGNVRLRDVQVRISGFCPWIYLIWPGSFRLLLARALSAGEGVAEDSVFGRAEYSMIPSTAARMSRTITFLSQPPFTAGFLDRHCVTRSMLPPVSRKILAYGLQYVRRRPMISHKTSTLLLKSEWEYLRRTRVLQRQRRPAALRVLVMYLRL